MRSWNAVWHHRRQTADILDTARQFEFGGFRLDRLERQLFFDGQPVGLTPKAAHILLVLVEARGQLVTKQALMQAVWPETFVEEGNLTFNIHTLRKTLNREDDGPERFIETVRARGYRFVADVREAVGAAGDAGPPLESEASVPAPALPDTNPWSEAKRATAVPAQPRRRTSAWALVAIAAGFAALVPAAWRWVSGPRPSTVDADLVRLTNSAGENMDPHVSPDGSAIAFTSTRDGGKGKVYVMDANGARVRNLSNTAAHESAGPWSPDGRFIAFGSDRTGEASIFVMRADGTAPRLVAAGARPAWSHDGQWLVLSARIDGHNELAVVPSAGGAIRRLTFDGDFVSDPSWSPDGSRIAFTCRKNGKLEIQTIHPDGTGRELLTASAGDDRLPIWSPDGRRLLFNSTRDGTDSLFLIDVAGGGRRRVTGGVTVEDEGAWSPDGQSILFNSDRDGHVEIYRMHLPSDPDGAVRLTRDAGSDDYPDWSPDGRSIAFESNRDGKPAIFVMDPSGGGAHRVTTGAASDRMPRWSPDGGRLAWASDHAGTFAIYVMHADGTGLIRVSEGGGDVLPRWSPDGQQICFTRDVVRGTEIRIAPASGGASRSVTKGDGCAWSRDGRTVLFDRDDAGVREVFRLNLDTGSIAPMTQNGRGNGGALASPDGGRIAFNSNRDGHLFGLFLMNADGSAQTRISSTSSFDFHPSWSPDGRWIVFGSNRDGNNEIYKIAVPAR